MKTISLSILFSVLLRAGFTQSIPAESLYLGQTPPGTTPKVFNIDYQSGYVITERIAISRDDKEIYYAEGTPPTHWMIRHFTYANDAWSESSLLFDNYTGPALSPGDDTLFFHKYYNTSSWLSNIYFSVRDGSGWSTPSVFAGDISMGWLQMTDAGDFYVTRQDGSLGVSKMVISDSDTVFHSMGIGNREFFISRDESFIIFSSDGGGGFGRNDLFVSYRRNDATWTDPVNLGSTINTSNWDVSPYVTPDEKYLFYVRVNTSGGRALYWVKADELIDSLRIASGVADVKGFSSGQDIIIYPNPSNGQFNIILGEVPYRVAMVEVCDLEGRLILSSAIHNKTRATIDLSGHARGVYLVKLVIDGEIVNRKIFMD